MADRQRTAELVTEKLRGRTAGFVFNHPESFREYTGSNDAGLFICEGPDLNGVVPRRWTADAIDDFGGP